jgi:nicotinamide-nucleotide adenylyltransferase
MNTCLFIGRFQPFHKGHLMVLKGMVKICHRVVIGIGSPDAPFSTENPFSLAERKEMIQRALQDEDLIPQFNIDLMEIPDQTSDEEWAEQCLQMIEDIDTVWTGNEEVKKCFENKSVKIQTIKEVPGISSTNIRQAIKEGKDWKKMVPEAVVTMMIEVGGVERMRK